MKVTTGQFLCIGYGSSGFTHGMRDLFGGGILDLKIFSSCFARYIHASTYSWLLLFFSCEVCCVVSCVKCLDVCQRHSADLLQLDNGIKVPPSGWKCEKCDLRENLWLNLTDGAILCGRRNFDGSGGNNHAVEHYQVTSYPLAVKLGTITPDGAGEVVLLA